MGWEGGGGVKRADARVATGTCAARGLISFGKRKLIKYAVAGLSGHVSPSLSAHYISLFHRALHS